jgi:hypothetical protein
MVLLRFTCSNNLKKNYFPGKHQFVEFGSRVFWLFYLKKSVEQRRRGEGVTPVISIFKYFI